jgi:hypothetical protein
MEADKLTRGFAMAGFNAAAAPAAPDLGPVLLDMLNSGNGVIVFD